MAKSIVGGFASGMGSGYDAVTRRRKRDEREAKRTDYENKGFEALKAPIIRAPLDPGVDNAKGK